MTGSLDLEDTVIGGQGIVVELDETKMGKRKWKKFSIAAATNLHGALLYDRASQSRLMT